MTEHGQILEPFGVVAAQVFEGGADAPVKVGSGFFLGVGLMAVLHCLNIVFGPVYFFLQLFSGRVRFFL